MRIGGLSSTSICIFSFIAINHIFLRSECLIVHRLNFWLFNLNIHFLIFILWLNWLNENWRRLLLLIWLIDINQTCLWSNYLLRMLHRLFIQGLNWTFTLFWYLTPTLTIYLININFLIFYIRWFKLFINSWDNFDNFIITYLPLILILFSFYSLSIFPHYLRNLLLALRLV